MDMVAHSLSDPVCPAVALEGVEILAKPLQTSLYWAWT